MAEPWYLFGSVVWASSLFSNKVELSLSVVNLLLKLSVSNRLFSDCSSLITEAFKACVESSLLGWIKLNLEPVFSLLGSYLNIFHAFMNVINVDFV